MIKIKSFNLNSDKIPTLVVPVCEDEDIHTDPVVSGLTALALAHAEFNGKKGDDIILYDMPETRTERVVFMGLGKQDTVTTETLRAFSGRAVKWCMAKNLPEVVLAAPDAGKLGTDAATLMEAMLEGALLANYVFDAYKQEKKATPLSQVFLSAAPAVAKKTTRLPKRVAAACEGTLTARSWINTPANDQLPEAFAKEIAATAKKAGLTVTVLEEPELKRQKFGALLAVAAGSDSKARLVVLSHEPKGAKKTIALVGKGVTFDSGGINLKPTGSIETMKTDMSGAAAVAATLLAVAKLKPKTRVIGVLPIVENMPSGSAIRPGDIVTSYAGKTVEIGNTDAEGRLILIDAMAYAIKKFAPDTIIDLATLTGACVVALGKGIAGVFTEDDDLAEAFAASGRKTHERCWRLPLPEDYRELLKSDIADISNTGTGRWAGAITAALFLKDFVGDTRWAHLDIAGPARADKAGDYHGVGGTGFGVRLLCDLLGKL